MTTQQRAQLRKALKESGLNPLTLASMTDGQLTVSARRMNLDLDNLGLDAQGATQDLDGAQGATQDLDGAQVQDLATQAQESAQGATQDLEEAQAGIQAAVQGGAQGGALDLARAIEAVMASVSASTAQALPREEIIDLIKQHSDAPKTFEIRRPTGEVKKIDGAHKLFDEVLAMAEVDVFCYLYGPAGTGKTTLARQLADALGRPFYMASKLMTEFSLLGFVDAHGKYQSTAFYRAWVEGGIFLFDEMDASSPAALAALNDALASGKCTFPTGEEIAAADGFYCLGAGNTTGHGGDRHYTARHALDGATLDRFAYVHLTYDAAIERAAAKAEFMAYGGQEKDLPKLADMIKRYQALRQAADKAGTGLLITPRATIFAARLKAGGRLNDHRIEDVTLWKGATKDQKAATIKALEA